MTALWIERLASQHPEVDPAALPADAVALGVIGARGGAGAGVLAASLARCSATLGRSTLLADVDPLGTGVAQTFAGTGPGEIRTPTLGAANGRLLPGSLLSALPLIDGVHLLSRAPWGPEPALDTLPGVLDSALRDFDVMVVDLPRGLDPIACKFAQVLDLGLVVVPAEPAAMRAAQHLVQRLSTEVADLRLVVRGPEPRDLPWQEIEQALGLPVQARLAPEPGLDRALARGEPPGLRRRSPLTATAHGILGQVFAQIAAQGPGRDQPFGTRRSADRAGDRRA